MKTELIFLLITNITLLTNNFRKIISYNAINGIMIWLLIQFDIASQNRNLTSVSHEYIRKAQLITNELFWRNKNIVAPDYVNYDVQWIPTDSGWSYFHMLTDNQTKKIIAVELTEDEEKETTKNFFKKVFRCYPKVMITDLKPGYHELIKDKSSDQIVQMLYNISKELDSVGNKKYESLGL